MAFTNALSILQDKNSTPTPATLQEIYGAVIDGVRKSTLSQTFKPNLYTGNPIAGSVQFKRFVNATSKNYGTARAAGKGDKLTVPPVIVNVDQHKEIVEEVNKHDMDAFGVENLIARRAVNHVESMTSELESAFFSTAATAATAVTLTGITAINEQLEAAVQTLETVKNDYVVGVPRNLITVFVTPTFYGKLRTYLDDKPRSNVDSAAEDFGTYHGIRVYSTIYLPEGVDAILMANGSIAQPVVTYPYTDAEKIPLSNDFAVELFYDYGTKALTPDLIFKIGTPSASTEESK